jgi:prolipoprotein diacylglyceryltransferase
MNFTILSFATLSDFIREIFGADIPLPVQTYGFFVAMAFVAGTWIMTIEYKRKEKLGMMGAVYKVVTIGEKPSVKDLAFTFIISFLISYKLVGIIFNYREFTLNAQEFLLSDRGSFVGGLLIAAAATWHAWNTKNKKALSKPKQVILKTMPHQLA